MICRFLILLGLSAAVGNAQVVAPSIQISAGPVVQAVDKKASKMIVTTDTVGICINGTVTNVQRLNPALGMAVPGATDATDCSSYALGETFTLGYNGSHLNVYDANADTVSSVSLPGAGLWTHTGLLPNNERFAACVFLPGLNSFQLYTLDGTAMTAHENSTLFNTSCVAGGVVGTDVGEDIFLIEGSSEIIHFASMEDRDDDAVVYVDDREVEIGLGFQLVEAKAAYSGLVMVRHINDVITPIVADGTGAWSIAQPIDHGFNVVDWDVSKIDGTLFIQFADTEMTVFTRDGNNWVNQGNFSTDLDVIRFDSLALNELYWYEDLGVLYNVHASVPTAAPTESPTAYPTDAPTNFPTASPTDAPTNFPTASPSDAPTNFPTVSPSARPTESPTTNSPSAAPTTPEPTTASPTKSPTVYENSVDGTTLGVIFGSVMGATIVGIIVYTMWAN
jgi:hypothetical protein